MRRGPISSSLVVVWFCVAESVDDDGVVVKILLLLSMEMPVLDFGVGRELERERGAEEKDDDDVEETSVAML